MIYLIIAIASMSLIMLSLKFFGVKGIYVPQAIIVNYGLAFATALLAGRERLTCETVCNVWSNGWWYLAVIAGLLYFGSMDIMALSTRRVGVSVTTMASRTAVVLPILWAVLFLGEHITGWEVVGILLVLAAFIFIIYRPDNKSNAHRPDRRERLLAVALPVAVFLTIGFIAVCMKTSQHIIKTSGSYEADYPVFETLLFASAFLGSIIYYGITQGMRAFRLRWKSVAGGVCLGAFNYFVTLGIMNGLQYFSSSAFYGLYNISVVIAATLAGVFIFREKLDGRKTVGLALAVAAIFVLGFLGGSL